MKIERVSVETVMSVAEEVIATVHGKCDIESEAHIMRCIGAFPNIVSEGKRVIILHNELEQYSDMVIMLLKKCNCIAVISTSRDLPVSYHKIISDFKMNACESIVCFDDALGTLMIVDIIAFKPNYNREVYDTEFALTIL